jgi:hypothetical protein
MQQRGRVSCLNAHKGSQRTLVRIHEFAKRMPLEISFQLAEAASLMTILTARTIQELTGFVILVYESGHCLGRASIGEEHGSRGV